MSLQAPTLVERMTERYVVHLDEKQHEAFATLMKRPWEPMAGALTANKAVNKFKLLKPNDMLRSSHNICIGEYMYINSCCSL